MYLTYKLKLYVQAVTDIPNVKVSIDKQTFYLWDSGNTMIQLSLNQIP